MTEKQDGTLCPTCGSNKKPAQVVIFPAIPGVRPPRTAYCADPFHDAPLSPAQPGQVESHVIPQWITDAATEIVAGAYALHQRPIIGNADAIERNGLAQLIYRHKLAAEHVEPAQGEESNSSSSELTTCRQCHRWPLLGPS